MPCWRWKYFCGIISIDQPNVLPSGDKWDFTADGGRCLYEVSDGVAPSDLQYPYLFLAGNLLLADRSALLHKLGFSSGSRLTDRALVLEAYLKWGSDLAGHLSGSFSFVIWDSLQRTLTAARDHLGSVPLFYRYDRGAFSFAGDMRTMLRRFGSERSPNLRSVIAYALIGQYHPVCGETYHEGIWALPAGTVLVLRDNNVNISRYWTLEIRPELIPARDSDAWELARHLVTESVGNQIESVENVGILLSGGLDSSALAVTAAGQLKARGRKLVAFAAVNEPANADGPDERPWVEHLKEVDNLEIQYLERTGAGPFDGIEDASRFETNPHLGMPYFYGPLMQAATDQGMELLLSGNFWEMTISGTPSFRLLDMLREGNWGAGLHEAESVRRRTGNSRLKQLASELRHLLIPGPAPASPFFLRREFQNPTGLPRVPGSSRSFDSRVHHLNNWTEYLGRECIRSTMPPESVFGLSLPYLTKSLVEFTLALPARFKVRDGYARYLHRKAFERDLPPVITWRRGKYWACPDYYERFHAQMPKALEFVRSIRKSDPVREIVDVPRLEASIRPVRPEFLSAYPRKIDFDLLLTVPTTIQLICFLRQFSGFRV